MIVCAVNDHKIVEEQVAPAVENQTSPRAAFMDITNKILEDPFLPKMKSFDRKMSRMKQDDFYAPPIQKTCPGAETCL